MVRIRKAAKKSMMNGRLNTPIQYADQSIQVNMQSSSQSSSQSSREPSPAPTFQQGVQTESCSEKVIFEKFKYLSVGTKIIGLTWSLKN